MTANNTSLEGERALIWEGDGERLMGQLMPEGSIHLMRVSEVDDGPMRSISIKPGALGRLANWLNGQDYRQGTWPRLPGQIQTTHEEIEEMEIIDDKVVYSGPFRSKPQTDYGCGHDEFPGLGH